MNVGLDEIFETVSSMQKPTGACITIFLGEIIAREVGGGFCSLSLSIILVLQLLIKSKLSIDEIRNLKFGIFFFMNFYFIKSGVLSIINLTA
jgi:hypothetical protein